MMKSILSVLPLVAFAVAQKGCTKAKPVIVTETETYTVTVPAVSAAALEVGDTTVIVDVTTTHTVYITPSPKPYYPLPNGTHAVPHPSTFVSESIIYVSPSPIGNEAAPAETSYAETSAPVVLPTSEAAAAASTSTAAAAVSSVAPVTNAQATTPNAAAAAAALSGEATYYGGNTQGGMCSFTGYTLPSGLFGTALSDSNWAGAQACGACVSVTGPSGNNITAMITDQCPGCGSNHLDLYPDAFAKLADPAKGVINVIWDFVDCGITTPIVLKNKEGTSPYWFSMQVMNANVRVSKLEVSTDGGSTWKATTRQPYNYFENSSGFGTDSVDVKVTSVDGTSIIVKSVSIAASSTMTAASNF